MSIINRYAVWPTGSPMRGGMMKLLYVLLALGIILVVVGVVLMLT